MKPSVSKRRLSAFCTAGSSSTTRIRAPDCGRLAKSMLLAGLSGVAMWPIEKPFRVSTSDRSRLVGCLSKAAAYNGFPGIMAKRSSFDNYFTLTAVNKGVLGQEVARGGPRTSDVGRQTAALQDPGSEVRGLRSEV